MYANASEALAAMKPDLSDTKVARNTWLTYYHDELIALRFHRTEIAMFMPWGVKLDVRGITARTDARGWFTKTTWRRIDELTPASVRTERGLKLIGPNENIYVHGTQVLSDGIVVNHPIEPLVERRIRDVTKTYPQKLRRYADQSVAAWLDWQQPNECCMRANVMTDDYDMHLLTHVEQGDVVVLRELEDYANALRQSHERSRENFIHTIRAHARCACRRLMEPAIARLAPDLTYPQRFTA